MTDTFELTLNNPLTEEQWDMIADVDFDHTDRIWFHTKHCKKVEFTKVIRCKDCKHKTKCFSEVVMTNKHQTADIYENVEWCSLGERKTDND